MGSKVKARTQGGKTTQTSFHFGHRVISILVKYINEVQLAQVINPSAKIKV